MALHQQVFPSSTPTLSNFANISISSRRLKAPRVANSRRFSSNSFTSSLQQAFTRRSANYGPSICNNDFIQSLTSKFENRHLLQQQEARHEHSTSHEQQLIKKGEKYTRRVEELKEYAKHLLVHGKDQLAALQMIDTLKRLGVGYLFQDDINGLLCHILDYFSGGCKMEKEMDLYSTALLFRLCRQDGYMVKQDVFNRFLDKNGNFQANLCTDTEGNLSLYDASFLVLEDEPVLDEARAFSTKNLKDHLILGEHLHHNLKDKVVHALEAPYHWNAPILEAVWFINTYKREENIDPKLLELAKLEHNLRQVTYQSELKSSSMWWMNTGLPQNLCFSRDRLAECYLWALCTNYSPQYSNARLVSTRINQLITTIDDIYDLYGSLDELERFTDVIARWDINAIEQLPGYMQLPFFVLFNCVNELACTNFQEQGRNFLPYLKGLWAEFCKSQLQEARWFYGGYTPTLDEYLENGVCSVSGILIIGSAYVSSMKADPSNDIVKSSSDIPEIAKWSSTILRLWDDLGTSTDEISRGDVHKSIQCYMSATGASKEVAQQHMKNLIDEAWKKANKDLIVGSHFPRDYVDIALGLARITYFFYGGEEDKFGSKLSETFKIFKQLLVEPIPLED